MNAKILVSSFIIIILCGCAGPQAPITRIESQMHMFKEYTIGIGDVLEVNVWRNPELSISVPVRPDGKISVPLLGDVIVGRKTPEKVAKDISVALKEYIREPQVTVIVAQMNSYEFVSRIRVTGAVNKQISIFYRKGMTVLDAILEAEGPNDFADANAAKLFRKSNDGVINKYEIELKDILNAGKLTTNYALEPGDVIVVPERFF